MKNVRLEILDVQLFADGSGVVITKQSKDNPSDSGVFKQTSGQLERLANRAGTGSVLALKHLASLGGSSFVMDTEECKKGEAYIDDRTGEEGIYTKDFINTKNEAVDLSHAAKSMIIQISLQNAFAQAPVVSAPAPIVEDADDAPEA